MIDNGLTQEQEEQEEAEFLQSMREWPGPMPQLTGEGWRMLIRAAEREKAVRQKSKQAAIEKYGAVLVRAPSDGRASGIQGSAPTSARRILTNTSFPCIAVRIAAPCAAPGRRAKPATRPPIPMLEIGCTLRAVERMYHAPSRAFVGANLLEARRD